MQVSIGDILEIGVPIYILPSKTVKNVLET